MNAPNSEMERIDRSWDELCELVATLGAIDETVDATGWAVKDHLVHVAAWERSLPGLIEGRDGLAAMGVPDAKNETDAINDAVWKQHSDDAPDQVLADFRRTHEQLMAALGRLNDSDLQKPYSHYQPNDPDEKRPVIDWVAGNTYEHYEEHAVWIKELTAQRR